MDYNDDIREIEDHVYCIYEFPGKKFDMARWKALSRDAKGNALHNNVVTVTYTSIDTNSFEPYGECVMGSKGTLIVEMEEKAFLFGEGNRSTLVVSTTGGQAAISTSGSAPSTITIRRTFGVDEPARGRAGVTARSWSISLTSFATASPISPIASKN